MNFRIIFLTALSVYFVVLAFKPVNMSNIIQIKRNLIAQNTNETDCFATKFQDIVTGYSVVTQNTVFHKITDMGPKLISTNGQLASAPFSRVSVVLTKYE